VDILEAAKYLAKEYGGRTYQHLVNAQREAGDVTAAQTFVRVESTHVRQLPRHIPEQMKVVSVQDYYQQQQGNDQATMSFLLLRREAEDHSLPWKRAAAPILDALRLPRDSRGRQERTMSARDLAKPLKSSAHM